jgi:hypothetical protein
VDKHEAEQFSKGVAIALFIIIVVIIIISFPSLPHRRRRHHHHLHPPPRFSSQNLVFVAEVPVVGLHHPLAGQANDGVVGVVLSEQGVKHGTKAWAFGWLLVVEVQRDKERESASTTND